MDDSMAQRRDALGSLELPGWKATLNWIAAVLTAMIFIVSGLWKITDPIGAAVRLSQARLPESISLPATIVLGIAETVAAVLVLVPRFRKWGAWLASALLVAFMIYIGVNYNALHGEECNCFPLIKRAVGPGFFIGDGIMLLLAFVAGYWARPAEGKRSRGELPLRALATTSAAAAVGVIAALDAGLVQSPRKAAGAASELRVRKALLIADHRSSARILLLRVTKKTQRREGNVHSAPRPDQAD